MHLNQLQIKPKKAAGHNLEDKFREIDDLLSYDETPKERAKKDKDYQAKLDSKNKVSKFQNDKDKESHKEVDYGMTMHKNMLDEVEVSINDGEQEQSEAETVYGIRTNFNAVNEYLNLLMKFLKEKFDELKLPPNKNRRDLILRRIHNLADDL